MRVLSALNKQIGVVALFATCAAVWISGCGGKGSGSYGNPVQCGRQWSAPQRLTDGDVMAYGPRVAAHSDSTVWVVWIEGFNTVRARLYRPGVGWEPAEVVADNQDSATDLQIGIDGTGTVHVMWFNTVSGDSDVLTARHDPGSGWSATVQIEPAGASFANDLALAVNGSGQAVAVWEARADHDVTASVYDPASGWSNHSLLDADVKQPKVGLDSAGNAVVMTYSAGGVWSYRYEPGTGWSAAVQLRTLPADTVAGPIFLSVAGPGEALGTWEEWHTPSGDQTVWWSLYAQGTGWDAAAPFEPGGQVFSGVPRTAWDGSGTAVAAWRHIDDSDPQNRRFSLWTAEYTTASGWTAPVSVVDETADGVDDPLLDLSDSGERLLLWKRGDGGYALWTSCFDPVEGWAAPGRIDRSDDAVELRLDGMLDPSGNGAAAWSQSEGSEPNASIWASVLR